MSAYEHYVDVMKDFSTDTDHEDSDIQLAIHESLKNPRLFGLNNIAFFYRVLAID